MVVFILLWNGFRGSPENDKKKANRNAEITLAGTNGNTNTSAQSILGHELTTKDCTKAISSATTTESKVSLTLDAGGIVGDARKLIDVLKTEEIPAALFATGTWAVENAEIVKAYADAGFDVFSRGNDRTAYTDLTKEKISADLDKAEAAIVDDTGLTPKPYLRPPGGAVDATVIAAVRSLGYCPILSTVDALDIETSATIESGVARVQKALKKGAIIVVHANSDLALELVPALAKMVKDEGYSFATLRDLLRVTTPATTSTNTNSAINANR